jgi:hypothetical protein
MRVAYPTVDVKAHTPRGHHSMWAVHVHCSNIAYGKAVPTVQVRHAYGCTCTATANSTVQDRWFLMMSSMHSTCSQCRAT